ncbi:MAG: hypothetical protein REI11_20085 [Patulibacter sp.]|nr:hypothetical protein [Patulibacter sp.]
MTVGQRVSGVVDVHMPAGCKDAQRRPRYVVIACGDGNFAVHHLHWRTWGGTSATAVGDVSANDCIPYCAAGHFHDYPVKLRVWRPRQLLSGDVLVFTRMRLTYVAGTPSGSDPRAPTFTAEISDVDDEQDYWWRD